MREAQDLTLPTAGGLVNLRVGAIIERDGKLLMVHGARGYYYSVGGRIRFGETAEEAIVREVEEETGVRLGIDRLGFVEENFFTGDSDWNKGLTIYELSFYFYMKTPPDFAPPAADLGAQERLEWVAPDTDRTLYPALFRTALCDQTPYVRHVVRDDRQNK